MRERLRLLKELYTQRAFGFEFSESFLKQNHQEGSFSSSNKCQLCQLNKILKHIIYCHGVNNQQLPFYDTKPNNKEAKTRKAFIGRSSNMIQMMAKNVLNLTQDEIFLTYLVKCKTPNNRVPNQDEIDSCFPFLTQQIKALNPKVIIAFGELVYTTLFNDNNFSRGELYNYGNTKLITTYSPSYILRNPSVKKDVQEDLLKAKSLL